MSILSIRCSLGTGCLRRLINAALEIKQPAGETWITHPNTFMTYWHELGLELIVPVG
jgi:hypothetical protein